MLDPLCIEPHTPWVSTLIIMIYDFENVCPLLVNTLYILKTDK